MFTPLRAYITFSIITLIVCCQSPDQNLCQKEFSIDDASFEGKATITPTSKGFRIRLVDPHGHELDRTIFNYQIYRFDTADVDRDGNTELLIGLTKPTVFDPIEKKRLFILRIHDGQLRPLWLGSRVCQQLIDFKSSNGGIIKTIERTKDDTYAIGLYEWQSFGLTLINYTHNEKSYADAFRLFDS